MCSFFPCNCGKSWLVALTLGFGACGEGAAPVAEKRETLTDVDEVVDLGLVYLDAAQPARLAAVASLQLAQSKRYGFKCEGRRHAAETRVRPIVSLYIVQPGQGGREFVIGQAFLRRLPSGDTAEPFAYQGVVKQISRSGKAKLRLRSGKLVIMEQEVTIRP